VWHNFVWPSTVCAMASVDVRDEVRDDSSPWPPALSYAVDCPCGHGMAACAELDVVVVSANQTCVIYVYSLSNGSLQRTLGRRGCDPGSLDFAHGFGGLCVTPRRTLMVAEYDNGRLQVR
jgi:hypothetical protein